MKKGILSAILLLSLFACSKKGNTDNPVIDKINFTYNGNQYNLSSSGSYIKQHFLILLSANFAGLYINRPDLFGGTIDMACNTQGNIICVYHNPAGMNVTGACNSLTNNGAAIDSVKVYWYESGAVNFSYSDCKNTPNGYTGEQDCIITGSFNFTLTNKNNQKIILSNGSFFGRIKKY